MSAVVSEDAVQAAQSALDAHTVEMMAWHFSPETGTPFWIDWAREAGIDPIAEVKGFSDIARVSVREPTGSPVCR